MLGKIIKVKVDRPLGSCHPHYPELIYPINYGYVEGMLGGDKEEQDVYIMGVDKAVLEYEGEVIAIIKREDDIEDKWVVAQKESRYTLEEIKKAVEFQEKYYKITIVM